MAKKQKQWAALIAADYTTVGWRPHVLTDENGDVATFSSVAAIEKVMMTHMLAAAVWQAWNFTTGEVQMIG